MKRRNFIANAALLTGVMASGAHGVLALEPKVNALISLGDPKAHVRHGLFNNEMLNLPLIPSWLKFHRPHRLFKNGVHATEDDLRILSFEIAQEAFTLGFAHNFAQFQSTKGMGFSFEKGHAELVSLGNGFSAVLVHNATQKIDLSAAEGVLIAVDGSVTIKNQILKHGEFHLLQHFKSIEISAKNGLALLIAKH